MPIPVVYALGVDEVIYRDVTCEGNRKKSSAAKSTEELHVTCEDNSILRYLLSQLQQGKQKTFAQIARNEYPFPKRQVRDWLHNQLLRSDLKEKLNHLQFTTVLLWTDEMIVKATNVVKEVEPQGLFLQIQDSAHMQRVGRRYNAMGRLRKSRRTDISLM